MRGTRLLQIGLAAAMASAGCVLFNLPDQSKLSVRGDGGMQFGDGGTFTCGRQSSDGGSLAADGGFTNQINGTVRGATRSVAESILMDTAISGAVPNTAQGD